MKHKQNTQKNAAGGKAVLIGVVFCLSYLASYYIRKLLGLSRTDIIDEKLFSKLELDSFQSLYMVFYAAGQLINGIIGDFLPPRRMIALGFVLSGVSMIVFPLTGNYWLSLFCFAVFGYGLSMLRGPMMKLIAENTDPGQARIICTFFNFSCYFGVFIASVFVSLFAWRISFLVSGGITLAVAVAIWLFIRRMENSGHFRTGQADAVRQPMTWGEILKIFRLPSFVYFLLIGGLIETANTTINYWIPSFVQGYLGQSAEFSNAVASVISVVIASCSFVALFLYHVSRGRTKPVILGLFLLSGLAFLTVLLSDSLWGSLIGLLLALLFIGCVSSLMWSIYIPSLARTGKVSGANGVLDCFGYLFASGANVLFSFLAGDPEAPTWNRLILAWIGISVIGILLTVFRHEPKAE